MNLEEEMKRLRIELASEGAYNQVSFSYDGDNGRVGTKVDTNDDSCDFKLPERLTVPDNVPIVSSFYSTYRF